MIMATAIKTQNGTAKTQKTATKQAVKTKLTEEATDKRKTLAQTEPQTKAIERPIINLETRIQKFEQLRGLALKRERLVSTLNDLNRFKYNQSDSSSFFLRDSQGLEFKTTNNILIQLVTDHLKATLETRKAEIEDQLLSFEL